MWPKNAWYQIDFLESSLRSFALVTLASLFFSEDLFGYIPGISTTNHATKELSKGRCVRSKKQQTSPEMCFLKGDTNLTKRRSFSTTLNYNCKHSLNLTCQHTKGMQLRWPKYGQSNLNLSTVCTCKPILSRQWKVFICNLCSSWPIWMTMYRYVQ